MRAITLERMTIGAFAAAAGVSVETVRYYQRERLLNEPSKPSGSIRRYGLPDVERVRFIKSLVALSGGLGSALLMACLLAVEIAHSGKLAGPCLDGQ